jgi:hypothetical protein
MPHGRGRPNPRHSSVKLPPVTKKSDTSFPQRLKSNQPKRAAKSVCGTSEWLEWCAENQVLSQAAELAHYEIEACRRYFYQLKLTPSAPGVNPKTLAESFHRAEIFASFNDALGFCQKLSRDSSCLVTFTDLLDALHGSSFFKRNKVSSYLRVVASSNLFTSSLSTPSISPSGHLETDQMQHRQQWRQGSLPPLSESESGCTSHGSLVINRHTTLGSEVTVHPRKKSLQRQDSTEQYQKFILRKSYSRSESGGASSSPAPAAAAASPSQEPIKRTESGDDRLPASARRTKVAAIKIYATNRFQQLSRHAEETAAAAP